MLRFESSLESDLNFNQYHRRVALKSRIQDLSHMEAVAVLSVTLYVVIVEASPKYLWCIFLEGPSAGKSLGDP